MTDEPKPSLWLLIMGVIMVLIWGLTVEFVYGVLLWTIRLVFAGK